MSKALRRHSILADAAPRTDSVTVRTCQGYPLQLVEGVKTNYIKSKALNGNTNTTAWGTVLSDGGAVVQMGVRQAFGRSSICWEACHMSLWRQSGPEGRVGCSRGAEVTDFLCPED